MSSGNISDFEDIDGPTEEDRLLPRDRRPGYEQRRRVNQAGNFVYPDRGTFLGIKMGDYEDLGQMDNPIAVALRCCEEKVLRPYNRLLRLVAWQPLIETPTRACHKFVNVSYTLFVIILIVAGYIIQYAACFRRDRAGEGVQEHWLPIGPNMSSVTAAPDSSIPPCQQFVISQYLIPDLLHSAAYAYCFYIMRVIQSEQLPMLTEKVFLKTSPTESGFLSQGNLIRRLRLLLWGGLLWVWLSQVGLVFHVIAQYIDLNFHWMDPGSAPGRIFLLVVMCVAMIPLDLVYVAVVINYCVQCSLIIFFVEGLQTRIQIKSTSLEEARKEIAEIQVHLKYLNHHPGTAVSIIMVNFGTMIIMGSFALLEKDNTDQALMFIATSMAVLLWTVLMLFILTWAARVTATCNSLSKVGHEIRVRPFGYQDMSDVELDSFLLFMSTLSMKAKIFLIPVRSSSLCGLLVFLSVFLVLLFQLGVVHVWL